MKSLYLRCGAALACALGLAACGGGSGNLVLSGQIVGLSRTGLVLQENGGQDLAIDATATTFNFPTLITADTDYNVTVKSSPPSATCTAINGKGKSGPFNVTSVIINCVTFTYNVGGPITGLGAANTGLVLANGSVLQTIAAGATSFTMTQYDTAGKVTSGQVPDGSPYGITVLTQPLGKTCSVANGTGTMSNAAVTNVQVTCI
ncbi:MAG: hypothetical protein V4508_17295 [Pseudomonadota bacterium]